VTSNASSPSQASDDLAVTVAAAAGPDFEFIVTKTANGFSPSNVIDDGGIGFTEARLDSDKLRIRFSTPAEATAFAGNFANGTSVAVLNNPADSLSYIDPSSAPDFGEWCHLTGVDTDIQFTYSSGLSWSSGQIVVQLYVNGLS
jgi:hypothetical protein